MRPLSASEAISPAIDHTRFMLRPFRLGLWLKLGLVACFAEMGGQFMFPPVGNFPHHAASGPGIGAAGGFTALMTGFIVVGAIVGLLIGLALLYLGSRLQLVLMDLVATRTTLVGDAWHRTAPRTWRWIAVKVVCSLIAFACIAAIAAAPVIYFIRSMPAGGSQQPTPAFFGAFALFFIAIFAVIFILMIATWFLRDFVLPFILFEDASFADSLRRAWAIVANEPGACLFYLFLKFVLCFVAGIVAEFCIFAVVLITAIPTGIIGYILWVLLHHSGTSGTVMMYLAFALLGIAFVAVFIGAALCLGGAVLIFYQAYALYFIGGRIPQVGNLLEPSLPYYAPPAAFAPPPIPPGAL
jgi:hypothetical protein